MHLVVIALKGQLVVMVGKVTVQLNIDVVPHLERVVLEKSDQNVFGLQESIETQVNQVVVLQGFIVLKAVVRTKLY